MALYPPPLPPFLLFLLLLLLHPFTPRALSAVTVTHLPGFSGALPFRLETGYVSVDEVNDVELFYYFIQSEQRSPREAPVILWLTGGPGCSAFSGLVFEIGPLQFVTKKYDGSVPSLVYRNCSWTKIANVIFLDSPVGTGFSFSRNPEGYVLDDTGLSIQIHEFLKKWFIEHPEFMANHLYIAGDSYAGKFVPLVAHEIAKGIEAGHSPLLNLKGYVIGNAATGELVDLNSRVPYAHGVGIISDELYEDLLIPFIGTQAWIRSLNYSIVDDWRSWHVDGQVAGYTRKYSNSLTFATVKDAGHTAPEYKPKSCFMMLARWISHRPL
ncbi:uncharacterized protein A4U43_C09F16140 [Asparagus officinalis]|uniref:Carboxypeptidase n=1 Tax=Asparagus officinalis TaxID=4686 RepID=A0A5P1EB94_ASPOF|nr:uncharacterized protein A4U43_C09F16140 [Asparagus officinalis]